MPDARTVDGSPAVFKSNPASMTIDFFKLGAVVLALEYFAFLLVKPQEENVPMIIRVDALETVSYLDILPLFLVIAALIAASFVFIRRTIRIEVDANNISFFRRNNKYLECPTNSNEYYLCSKKKRTNIFSFYQRSYLIFAGRHTPARYQCYNFSQKTFKEMDLLVKSIRHSQTLVKQNKLLEIIDGQEIPPPYNQDYHVLKTPGFLELTIAKEEILQGLKMRIDKEFALLAAITVAVGFFHYYYDVEAYLSNLVLNLVFTIFIVLLSLTALVLAFVLPRRRIVKYTPRQIGLRARSITFDNSTYYYSEIEEIRLSPPVPPQNLGSRLYWIRVVASNSVAQYLVGEGLGIEGQPNWFMIGGDPIFPVGYGTLCNYLEVYLNEEPAKLFYEVG